MSWPRPERMLIAALPRLVPALAVPIAGAPGASRVAVETPADVGQTRAWLPFVRVQRVGGTREIGIDRAMVVVETYHSTRPAAGDLADVVDDAVMDDVVGLTFDGGVVIDTAHVSVPSFVPSGDPGVARFVGTYRLTVHNQR